ncbi:MAG TPA: hypothetical protein VNY05_42355 [Candidatus Acidoferrales bacterium]|jgi:hypothetical protein|nr:hypothetical protein [Candidatus Acidoferrales bacterium]
MMSTMRKFTSTATAGMTAIVFAAVFAGAANAKCGISLTPRFRSAGPALLSLPAQPEAQPIRAADEGDQTANPAITGLWYVQFIAGGQVVDDGFDVWHSDGTEVLNDSPAPSSGNVCLGVWVKTGQFTYTLKHPSWIFDAAGVNVIGIVVIREQITLSHDGNSYSGTSTLDVYDTKGNLLDHETAALTAQRITALDAPGHTSGIPGLPASILNR